jgi:hypothetical protein
MTNEQMIIEQNKKLVKRYPFLLPRNVWNDELPEDYDYSYINGIGELPPGWEKLFLQMCEDIRQPLINAGQLETFRFTQIKEKYNRMECYNNGSTEEVLDIIGKYTMMARLVCTNCGKPATYETYGYIASYCDDCFKDFVRHERGGWIKPTLSYTVRWWQGDGWVERIVSFADEWRKYLKSLESEEIIF